MARALITPALSEFELRLSGDREPEAPGLVNPGNVSGVKSALSLKGETHFSFPGN